MRLTRKGEEMVTNSFAKISFSIGIVDFLLSWGAFSGRLFTNLSPNLTLFILFILGITAVVTGVIALIQIRRRDRVKGNGLAIAGIVLGGLVIFWILTFVLFIAPKMVDFYEKHKEFRQPFFGIP
jgi:hypothetical protein